MRYGLFEGKGETSMQGLPDKEQGIQSDIAQRYPLESITVANRREECWRVQGGWVMPYAILWPAMRAFEG